MKLQKGEISLFAHFVKFNNFSSSKLFEFSNQFSFFSYKNSDDSESLSKSSLSSYLLLSDSSFVSSSKEFFSFSSFNLFS